MDPHRLAEARSLAYHRPIAERLCDDPTVVANALCRVERWLAEGRSEHYAREWRVVLSGPTSEICALLVEDSERARALRQSTPFAGVLGPRERWRIWKQLRAEAPE